MTASDVVAFLFGGGAAGALVTGAIAWLAKGVLGKIASDAKVPACRSVCENAESNRCQIANDLKQATIETLCR